MQSRRTPLLAALATGVALASAAPAAHAVTMPSYKLPSGASLGRPANLQVPVVPGIGGVGGIGGAGFGTPIAGKLCGNSVYPDGQGPAGTNNQTVCNWGGLTFVGPSTAITSVVGPTIISPGFVGTIITTVGNVGIG